MNEENKTKLKFSHYFHEVIIKELVKKFNVEEDFSQKRGIVPDHN